MSNIEKIKNMFEVHRWLSNNLHILVGVKESELKYEYWDLEEHDEPILAVCMESGDVLYDNMEDIDRAMKKKP